MAKDDTAADQGSKGSSSHSRLTTILADLGEEGLTIQSAYIVKVGCVRILPSGIPDRESRFPITELEDLVSSVEKGKRDASDVLGEIRDSIEKHKNIFDVNTVDADRPAFSVAGTGIGTGPGSLVFGSAYSARVKLPARLQKHHSLFSTAAYQPIEQFDVVSSGSLFAAIAPIEDYPVLTYIGHEYRDLLRKQIEETTNFKSPALGPNPIHPDIYLVFRKRPAGAPVLGRRVYSRDDNPFIVEDHNSVSGLELAKSLLMHIEMPMLRYYSTNEHREILIFYHVEILNHFADLSEVIKGLSAQSWWHIVKSNRLARRARNSLWGIHSRLVEFDQEAMAANRNRDQLSEVISQSPILSLIKNYLLETSSLDIELPRGLYPALKHFEGELRTFGTIRSIVIASLAGGAVGALVSLLVSFFV